jgi:hypothetical protein
MIHALKKVPWTSMGMLTRRPRLKDIAMIRMMISRIIACLFLAISSIAGGLALAQGGSSGLPLDNLQFKGGHNSYDEDEDMDDQIDNYNTWCVELDLQWESDCGNPGCITVDHCCWEMAGCWGEQRLYESIEEIKRSTEIGHRITFIWFDIKDSGKGHSWCHETWPSNRRDLIRATLVDLLGLDNIYTRKDFDDVDFSKNGGHWPSWQNLRDRGKKFILVLEDTIDPSGRDNDVVLFIAVGSLEDTKNIPWATFITIQDADTTKGVPKPNDRYIYRAWFDIGTHDPESWETAVSRGFNLIATDDMNQGYTITDSRTHSPQPLYVNGFDFDANRLWGTRNYPMNGIMAASARATPGTTLRIRPGNYPGPYTFDKSMIVEKNPAPRYAGPVVIGTQY